MDNTAWKLAASTALLGLGGALMVGCGPATTPTPVVTPTPTPKVTAPTRAAIAKAPSVVTISCTPKGTRLSNGVVTTSPTGVKLTVVNTTKASRVVGYRVEPPSGAAAQLGLIQPTRKPAIELYPLPPGRMDLRCGRSANVGLDKPVTLFIVDLGNYYFDVNTEVVLGCTPKPLTTPRDYIDRATASDALTLLNDQLPSGRYTFKTGPGYKAARTTKFLVFKNGKGYGIATVTTLPNFAYHPRIVALC